MIELKTILVDDEIRAACPQFIGRVVYAEFTNSKYSESLWAEIALSLATYRANYTTESIKQVPSIQATRSIYKVLGKDPSRYRPSGEALVRRVLQGKDLYQIDTAVDLINLASIEFGYSIGGIDYDKVQGDTVTLGVGKKDEPYEGIGRGQLNVEGLPVYRDKLGGFATPTSDNERTKMELTTTHLLAFVNAYDGNASNAEACAKRIVELLKSYAQCSWCEICEY